ncbi:MAG: PQQ-dependent sugar dehydrogenase [Thermomicrobiales bacterium]
MRGVLGLVVVLALLLAGSVAAQGKSPPAFGDAPGAFRVTVFADGLDFPAGMTSLPDGSILVGTSRPVGGSYFQSSGELLRLVDADGDGAADDERTVLAHNLPGTITAVARAGNLVFVTSAEKGRERISFWRSDGDWQAPLELVGSIDFRFELFEHQTYGLAVSEYADDPRRVDLFFNVGAYANFAAGGTVDVDGLVSATLQDASIYRVTVEDNDGPVTVSDPELIATGLRNAAAFVIDPASGDLLIAENGIDTPDDRLEAFSADELDRIAAAEIGGEPEDFGFPASYVAYRTGEVVGEGGEPLLVTFQPLDGSESEGPAGIAVAPPSFPDGLNAGVFIGFHGQWDLTGVANEENPVVYADLATGEYSHVIGNEEPGVGHLNTLLATDDALYVADLCADGSMVGVAPCGVIYEIRPR